MNATFTKKINKGPLVFYYTLDQMDPIDTYRIFHPIEAECTFFSSAHETFFRIEQMLGNKTNLNKF